MSNIQDELIALNKRLREQFMSKWKRSIPFYEQMLGEDARWDRARSLHFGDGTSTYESSYVYGDVKVGRGTWIGPFTILDGTGGLTIGDYCSISSGVQIYTHETVEWALSGGKAKYSYAPVRIGSSCFIGSLTVIRMGVEIGDHVLVGAHSFVNNSIPNNSIAAGSPARVVGKVEVQGENVLFKYTTKGKRNVPGSRKSRKRRRPSR
jgi:acetyltransferase-like isoleucine patch superfamily enzyme